MLETLKPAVCEPALDGFNRLVAPSPPGPRERLLIVDDSPTVRKAFSKSLTPRFECIEAGSFAEAIEELRAGEFSVLITDVMMPGMSGIELLRRVMTDFPDTQVIVASGVNRPQRALDAVRLGAFDYLIKPFEPEVLQITVERALEHRNLIRESRNYKIELEEQNRELVSRKRQLERLQIQVVQNEKMASLGQLAAGVAHELNNPVGFVYANVEMLPSYIGKLVQLIQCYEEPEGVRESNVSRTKREIDYPVILEDIDSIVQDCLEGAERIREIVKNLRTFSRLDEAEYKKTNIHEGIDSTVRLLSRYFSSGDIQLVRDYGDLPLIDAFPGPLNQLWMNLLTNAAQAIEPKYGEISITTTADENNVFISVRDTGSGISAQDLKRIFDPFFTTKPVGDGTGLGLSISFGIVERHGGHIEVDSRLNEGTTFMIQLPQHYEPDPSRAEKSIFPYSEI